MSQPTTKQFSDKLDKIVELAKQRVRIGSITYSSKKDIKRFDTRNWLQEGMEEIADQIAYATFCYIQFEGLYRLLRQLENKLMKSVKEESNGPT